MAACESWQNKGNPKSAFILQASQKVKKTGGGTGAPDGPDASPGNGTATTTLAAMPRRIKQVATF
jgi:hypothetical protein